MRELLISHGVFALAAAIFLWLYARERDRRRRAAGTIAFIRIVLDLERARLTNLGITNARDCMSTPLTRIDRAICAYEEARHG